MRWRGSFPWRSNRQRRAVRQSGTERPTPGSVQAPQAVQMVADAHGGRALRVARTGNAGGRLRDLRTGSKTDAHLHHLRYDASSPSHRSRCCTSLPASATTAGVKTRTSLRIWGAPPLPPPQPHQSPKKAFAKASHRSTGLLQNAGPTRCVYETRGLTAFTSRSLKPFRPRASKCCCCGGAASQWTWPAHGCGRSLPTGRWSCAA